jgi:hypothetical protein
MVAVICVSDNFPVSEAFSFSSHIFNHLVASASQAVFKLVTYASGIRLITLAALPIPTHLPPSPIGKIGRV